LREMMHHDDSTKSTETLLLLFLSFIIMLYYFYTQAMRYMSRYNATNLYLCVQTGPFGQLQLSYFLRRRFPASVVLCFIRNDFGGSIPV
jgi:hypothetical protein